MQKKRHAFLAAGIWNNQHLHWTLPRVIQSSYSNDPEETNTYVSDWTVSLFFPSLDQSSKRADTSAEITVTSRSGQLAFLMRWSEMIKRAQHNFSPKANTSEWPFCVISGPWTAPVAQQDWLTDRCTSLCSGHFYTTDIYVWAALNEASKPPTW